MGLSRDSRRTRCACLIKESDVYKCKHSILFTRCSPAASYLELAGRGLFLSLSLFLKPSVKPNSIGVERHFIFDARTCALQTNTISLCTTKGAEVLPLLLKPCDSQDDAGLFSQKVVKHDHSLLIDSVTQGYVFFI